MGLVPKQDVAKHRLEAVAIAGYRGSSGLATNPAATTPLLPPVAAGSMPQDDARFAGSSCEPAIRRQNCKTCLHSF